VVWQNGDVRRAGHSFSSSMWLGSCGWGSMCAGGKGLMQGGGQLSCRVALGAIEQCLRQTLCATPSQQQGWVAWGSVFQKGRVGLCKSGQHECER